MSKTIFFPLCSEAEIFRIDNPEHRYFGSCVMIFEPSKASEKEKYYKKHPQDVLLSLNIQ